MTVELAEVTGHRPLKGGYCELVFAAPEIARAVAPGQFVHLRVPRLDSAVLRRPFSVHQADSRTLSILYKQVGRGTRAMAGIRPGDRVSLVGPLGNGFPPVPEDSRPGLVAGGYGVAPLSFLARQSPALGAVFIGGKREDDILCADEFEELGWDVYVTTEDGSRGCAGLVTDPLEEWLKAGDPAVTRLYACGPDGMLKAVAGLACAAGCQAWLSLDKHMGCGVGACLACVQRARTPDGGVAWRRVCKDGPVFEAREIVWDAG